MEELATTTAAVTAEVIKSLAKDAASFVVKKAKSYYVDITNNELIESGWAFEKYLRKVYNTYSESKSIIYINEPRKLSSFFEPPDLEYRSELQYYSTDNSFQTLIEKNHRVSGKILREVLKERDKIIITGIGGIGKTILLSHFCINAIEDKLKIPVFIPLRWFNNIAIGEEPLEKLIYEQLRIFGFELDYQYFCYSLEGDRYVFLLDGYDEICEQKRNLITQKLSSFSLRYSNNAFVLTSRQLEGIYSLGAFKILSLCPLTHEQAIRLIRRLDFAEDSKKDFLNKLSKEVYLKYKSFISIPLLLSILYLTFIDYTDIPNTLKTFYERAFEAMLFRHDNMKNGFDRTLKSGIGYENFRNIFSCFCFRTYFKNEYSFTDVALINNISQVAKKLDIEVDSHAYKSDLVDISCMIIKDAQEYIFIHRSFQEYFAAFYMSQQVEVRQHQFCDAFLHSELDAIFNTNPGVHAVGHSKVTEFFDMLYSIEPYDFEHIILQPIRAKIKELYENHNGDLLLTASDIFYLRIEKTISGFCSIESYFKECTTPEHGICLSEALVLNHFHWIAEARVECSLNKEEELKNIVDRNEGKIMECIVGKFNRKQSALLCQFTKVKKTDAIQAGCYNILLYISTEINRYEALLLQNKVRGKFNDMIDNF